MRILAIDDDSGLLRLYPRALRGHEVIAVGPEEALELMKEDDRFDVVICDLNLPRYGGRWFHERLVERARHLADRVVFCTGGGCDVEGWNILESAPDRVVLKPFDSDHLRAVVARLEPELP
ncbi:MAG: response regulator [Myxococcota bacterium]